MVSVICSMLSYLWWVWSDLYYHIYGQCDLLFLGVCMFGLIWSILSYLRSLWSDHYYDIYDQCNLANIKLYKLHTWAIFVSSHRFQDINIWNIWPWKSRSRSWSTTLAMLQPDSKCQNLLMSVVTFFIFAKIWPVRTILKHTQTELYVMLMAIGKSTDLRKK